MNWSQLTPKNVDKSTLTQAFREAGRPLHINTLARAAVRAVLEAEADEKLYAPGARYAPGETIRLKDESAVVKDVQDGGNPKQGPFKILTLELPDGTKRYMAVEVPGAPSLELQPATEEQARNIASGEHSPVIRAAVHDALEADAHFVWFQDAQGDHWCLAELLPSVTDEHVDKIQSLLQGLAKQDALSPLPTEELVRALWGQENDGSDAYLLVAFALNSALQRREETRWLGSGWVLEAEWQEFQQRPALVGPRQPNVLELPEGVKPPAGDEVDDAEDEVEDALVPDEETYAEERDLEAWRTNRLLNVTFTLKANHYYGHWLPLTKRMRRVFPPLASESYTVTLHYQFGDEEIALPACVDWVKRRILGTPEMYHAFYEHGIYPGAKLVLSHRGNLTDYDIRTKPPEGKQRFRVRRVFLSEARELEYEEVEEPLRYEVDGDVFVADARWEDLPALFQQAEQVGAGIFQLMYEKCCQWWEDAGRGPLFVTAQQLWEAIHYEDEGRLTSKATIAWELWRRPAFKSVDEGRYLFQPEYGDRTRTALTSRPKPPPPEPPVAPAFFVFQQRPDSGYADRPGEIYNWCEGIPGSKQITLGARFIHYRPGERVFFGTGRVASIEEYKGADEKLYYNGHIADYQLWDPPLPLTPNWASKISFIHPDHLGVGQAGIRRISQEDFETILDAYRQQTEGEIELRQIKEIVRASLVGQTVHTLTGRPNDIQGADEEGLIVATQSGKDKIPWEWIGQIYRTLRQLGEIERKDVQEGPYRSPGGFRSSFIFGLLSRFRHIEGRTEPRIGLIYHGPVGAIRLIGAGAGGPSGGMDLWAELEADAQKRAALYDAVEKYFEESEREKVLFLREMAHRSIRELLAEERLKTLALDVFNRQIWQIGSLRYESESHRMDTADAGFFLEKNSIEQLAAAYESGALEIQGNQTWGSAVFEFGQQLEKSDQEKEELVRRTLLFLLYGEGPIDRRMQRVIREPNGFGISTVSGILHAVHPEEHILYNRKSVDALEKFRLGDPWRAEWRQGVENYFAYRNFCWAVLAAFF